MRGDSTMVRSRTYIATPPGATIKEQLAERGMSQKEFSARMDMSEKHISKLINGDVQLTPDMAVRLEVVLGIPAQFWCKLEAVYREKFIKVKEENSMDEDVKLLKNIPYNEMSKLEWVPNSRNSNEKVINLRRFFEVVELPLLENNLITRIACRRLAITEKSDFALMAWAQKAKLLARDIKTAPINVKGLISFLPEIRKMTRQKVENFCERLRKNLATCGVSLVFLPHLQGSFLHGATFIDGNKIVIGITARGKDADRFWFSLFHEIAHIVLGHIGQPNGTSIQDESDADEWAKNVLIPSDKMQTFMNREDYSEHAIKSFAKEIEIAPGIIVGRLQNDGILKHNVLNSLKERYEIIA